MTRHKIYDVIDEEFRSFFLNNKKFLREVMRDGDIAKIKNKTIQCGSSAANLCATNMVDDPYNVAYIGKQDDMETYSYIFMDRGMDKIFVYWDDCEDLR